MKQILALIAASVLMGCMVSCNSTPEEVVHPEDGSTIFRGNAERILFNGHDYIIFRADYGTGSSISSQHDPNCTCDWLGINHKSEDRQ